MKSYFLQAGILAVLTGIACGGRASGEDRSHDHSHGHSHDRSQSHDHGGEKVVFLDVSYAVTREGNLEVEKKFAVKVEGKTIQRGPCLKFLSVFHGPGGLVLDNGMRIEEVLRNGEPEPYRLEFDHGMNQVFLGSADRLLDHGVHEYFVRYSAAGDWVYEGKNALASFDVTGPFGAMPIDSVRVRVTLPDGVDFAQSSVSISGSRGGGHGFEASPREHGLELETTSALEGGHSFFINAVWPTRDFAVRSRWLKVMQQHPRLPLSAFSGALLVWALGLLLFRPRKPAMVVSG